MKQKDLKIAGNSCVIGRLNFSEKKSRTFIGEVILEKPIPQRLLSEKLIGKKFYYEESKRWQSFNCGTKLRFIF